MNRLNNLLDDVLLEAKQLREQRDELKAAVNAFLSEDTDCREFAKTVLEKQRAEKVSDFNYWLSQYPALRNGT